MITASMSFCEHFVIIDMRRGTGRWTRSLIASRGPIDVAHSHDLVGTRPCPRNRAGLHPSPGADDSQREACRLHRGLGGSKRSQSAWL